MPTPIGHSLAGLAIYCAGRRATTYQGWPFLMQLVIFANLPDVDFIAGYLVGRPGAYHWGPTHSLTAAGLIGGIGGMLTGSRADRYITGIALTVTAYASHILLDMSFGRPSVPSLGLEVFWPFTTERFSLPLPLFKLAPLSVLTNPIGTLLSLEMLPVITRELIVMTPVVVGSWMFARAWCKLEIMRGKRT
jgi:membrane-bound metal-dependent hydrolase YbcI (DUF457 family)